MQSKEAQYHLMHLLELRISPQIILHNIKNCENLILFDFFCNNFYNNFNLIKLIKIIRLI